VAAYSGFLSGGDVNNEFDGRDKYARYREMWMSSPAIAATLDLIERPIIAAEWEYTHPVREIQEHVASMLFSPAHDQAFGWRDTLRHQLMCRRYGNYPFERVFFVGTDGRISAYLAPRPPDTIREWYPDGIRVGRLVQEIISDDEGSSEDREIPGDRLLHLVWDQEGNDLEGRSILRSCWGEFVSAREARNLRNIMVERAGGVPKLSIRDGSAPTVKGEDDAAVSTVEDFVSREDSYVMESERFAIEFLQTASDGIERAQMVMDYGDKMAAQRVLAHFMLHGQQQTGAFSAAKSQEPVFWGVIKGDARWIAQQNRDGWIWPVVRANWGDDVNGGAGELTCSDLRAREIADDIAPLVSILGAGGILTPELQRHLLGRAGAPRDVVEAVPDMAISRDDGTDDEGADPAKEAVENQALACAAIPRQFDYVVDRANPSARDGRFARALVGAERVVDFQALAGRWDDAESTASKLLDEFDQRFIASVVERIRPMIRANEPLSAAQLDDIRAHRKFVDEYTRKIKAIGVGALDDGGRQVEGELKRLQTILGVEPGKRVVVPTGPGYNPATTIGEIRKALGALASTAVSDRATKLAAQAAAEAAGQAIAPTFSEDAISDAMARLSKNEPLGALRNVVATGFNSGRDIRARARGAEWATYSTVLEDGKICDECKRVDLSVVRVGSAEDVRTRLPYKECISTRSARGRNRCRCQKVYSNLPPEGEA